MVLFNGPWSAVSDPQSKLISSSLPGKDRLHSYSGLSSTLLVEPFSFYDSVSTVHMERFKVHGSSSSSCFRARWHKNNAIPTSWTAHVQRLKFIDLALIASVQMPSNFSANCHKQQFKLNGSERNGPASEIQVLRIKFYGSSWSANDLLSAVERLVWLRRSKFKGSIRVVPARIFVFGSSCLTVQVLRLRYNRFTLKSSSPILNIRYKRHGSSSRLMLNGRDSTVQTMLQVPTLISNLMGASRWL